MQHIQEVEEAAATLNRLFHLSVSVLHHSSLLGFGMWGTNYSNQFCLSFNTSSPGRAAPLWHSCYLCWLCSDRPVCSPCPSSISAPGTVLEWKVPQSSSSADEVPPPPQTSSISLSPKHTHTHSQLSSQTRAIYSSTVVKLWCFLYHVCQWDISLSIFWLQPLHSKKRGSVCQPCFGLPAENHFNHFYTYWFWATTY